MTFYKYDYLLVGSGLFSSVFAQQAKEHGKKCLIIEKRSHIGGNCYTERHDEIDVHKYGPHIFHTNDKRIWDYINRWTEFNNFRYHPKVNYENKLFSFPINMMTFYQLWGTKTPKEVEDKLNKVKINFENPNNLEEWILSQVGEELYKTFIYGYTKKQWGKEPNQLPASIIKRLPLRFVYDENYFNDFYQGIPIGGYTKIFEKMLKDVPVELNIDYFSDREYFDKLAKKIVYTGAIDQFFNYEFGNLEWRSLEFSEEKFENLDFQGVAAINYTSESIPYTRIIEHKHFDNRGQKNTIITKEYPKKWEIGSEKYYPINDEYNNELLIKYRNMVDCEKYIFGGRLADYRYYDMHQVIGSSLKKVHLELNR